MVEIFDNYAFVFIHKNLHLRQYIFSFHSFFLEVRAFIDTGLSAPAMMIDLLLIYIIHCNSLVYHDLTPNPAYACR